MNIAHVYPEYTHGTDEIVHLGPVLGNSEKCW